MRGLGGRGVRVAMLVAGLVATGLLPGGSLAAFAQAVPATAGKTATVVAVTVPALDLYDEKGTKIGSMAKAQIPVPLAIEMEAPNKRLRVKLGGKSVWIERRFVRVEGGTTTKLPCDRTASSTGSRHVTALSTRGLDEGCRQ